MKLLTISDFQITKNDNGNTLIVVPGTNGQVQKIYNGLAIPTLYAITDALVLGRYNHRFTTKGLHIIAETDFSQFEVTNAGVVSWQYDGSTLPCPIPVLNYKEPEKGNTAWMQVNFRNNTPWTQDLRERFEKHIQADGTTKKDPTGAVGNRLRKHDIVDGLIQGVEFQIMVNAKDNNRLAQQLNIWAVAATDGVDAALTVRNNNIAGARERRELWTPSKPVNGTGEEVVVAALPENAEAIYMIKHGTKKVKVTLADMVVGSTFSWATHHNPIGRTITWYGDEAQIAAFTLAASKQYEIQIN